MVSSAHYRATRVGAAVLDAGGNAIDAAVATSLALAVVESAGSGIGGMAMMMVHDAKRGRTFALPGPCRAPALATPEAVASGPRYTSYRAVAVPTYVKLLDTALQRYGTMSARDVLAPAIELAEQGFPLTHMQHELISAHAKPLRRRSAARFFLNEAREPPAAGTLFTQPVLAATLRRLADAGLDDFYAGDIARSIDRDMQAHDGFVRLQDLQDVATPDEVTPITADFAGEIVATAPPPAGGRTLLQMLNLFSELAPNDFDADSPAGAALLAVTIRRARADRRRHRLDKPDAPAYDSREHAAHLAPRLRRELGVGETSHLCTIDRHGNAVSLTQSVERSFGAAVATPELGFLYNGYMKAFKIRARRHPHYLRAGAVARSNAAPTITLRDGKVRTVIGNTGSERMLSGIYQVLVRLARQTPFEAVHAPRLHVSPEKVVLIEADRFDAAALARLEALGYTLDRTDPYSFKFGGLHLARFDGDVYEGVAEPRRDGAAAGPSSD
jgi:gamma-glutamyltranspeptidase/glutathione hydrolase